MDEDYKLKPEQYFEQDIESIRKVRTDTYGMGLKLDTCYTIINEMRK